MFLLKMDRYNLRKNLNMYCKCEPDSDEYIHCDKCLEFVYKHCSIHGPYLQISDDKVSSKPEFPSFVPRAALTIPSVFLHLAPSRIPGAGLGVFSTLTLPRGVRFGPYRGKRTDRIQSMYCWQIYEHNKRSHVVDAADPNNSNWMRYVNCARHWCEQNLVAYQYKGQLYYRTIKTVPPFTELLVFYGTDYASYLNIDLNKYNSNCQNSSSTLKYNELNVKSVKNILPGVLETRKRNKKINSENNFSGMEENNYNFLEQNIKETFEVCSPHEILEDMKTKTWTCQYCDKVLSRNTKKSRHNATHKIKFICNLCPFKTKFKNEYTKHVERHEETSYVCNVCCFLATSIENLRHHKRRMHKIFLSKKNITNLIDQ